MSVKLATLAAVVVCLGGFAPSAGEARADPGVVLMIDSREIQGGEQSAVEVRVAGLSTYGLLVWLINIDYDASIVDTVSCSSDVSLCGTAFAPETVRATGATFELSEGDLTLAAVTFRCGAREGVSALSLDVEVWTDNLIGIPTDLPAVQEGSIACTSGASGLPSSGGGGAGSESTAPTVLGLAALGVAMMAYGAWRLSR